MSAKPLGVVPTLVPGVLPSAIPNAPSATAAALIPGSVVSGGVPSEETVAVTGTDAALLATVGSGHTPSGEMALWEGPTAMVLAETGAIVTLPDAQGSASGEALTQPATEGALSEVHDDVPVPLPNAAGSASASASASPGSGAFMRTAAALVPERTPVPVHFMPRAQLLEKMEQIAAINKASPQRSKMTHEATKRWHNRWEAKYERQELAESRQPTSSSARGATAPSPATPSPKLSTVRQAATTPPLSASMLSDSHVHGGQYAPITRSSFASSPLA